MTGLELAPVGDAREVPRTRVRRLDELCRFTLHLFFPSTTVLVILILGLDTMLRKASEARVNRRLRRYYLIVLLLLTVFALACLPLSSI